MNSLRILSSLVLISSAGFCKEDGAKPDIEHGNRQVRQMLIDRPAMATYETIGGETKTVTEKDTIWKWAAKSFGTQINGQLVEWSGEPPGVPLDFQASHTIPSFRSKGFINVRKEWIRNGIVVRESSFHELWYSAVFELFNIRSATGFLSTWDRRNQNKISRKEYVHENTKLEHGALLKAKEFHRDIWSPWEKQHSVEDELKVWERRRNSTPNDYVEWINSYGPDSPYVKYRQNAFDRKLPAEPRMRFTSEENARFKDQLRISNITDPLQIEIKRRLFAKQLRQWEIEDAKKRKWAEELRILKIEDAKRQKGNNGSGVPRE